MSLQSASAQAARTPRERLMAMLFLAALLHGLLILGVTFNSPIAAGRGAPGLRVLLVSDQLPSAAHNPKAAYLAQRTQLGSGNTRHDVQPNTPALQAGMPASAAGGWRRSAPPGPPAHGGSERVLTTTAWSTRVTYRISSAPGSFAGTLAAGADGARGASTGGPVHLRGPKRALWVSPDTRSAIVAPYLVAWRRKVERIGTLNFPVAARQAAHTNPVIEVAIDADGRLVRAVIRRSSGDPALDQAALAILRLASPFEPFPPNLAQRYRMLRFTYEWQFEDGRMRGSVRMP